MNAVEANTIFVCRLYSGGWHIEQTTPYDGNEAWNYGIPYNQAHEYTGQPCGQTTLPAAGGSVWVAFVLALAITLMMERVLRHDATSENN